MNTNQKNKSAVHLGKRSAEARKKKLGSKKYREYMKEISHKRKLYTPSFSESIDIER